MMARLWKSVVLIAQYWSDTRRLRWIPMTFSLSPKVLACTFLALVVTLAAAIGIGEGLSDASHTAHRATVTTVTRTHTVTINHTVTVTRTVRIVPSACREYLATANDMTTAFGKYSAAYSGTIPELEMANTYILTHNYLQLKKIVESLTTKDGKADDALTSILNDMTDIPTEKAACDAALSH